MAANDYRLELLILAGLLSLIVSNLPVHAAGDLLPEDTPTRDAPATTSPPATASPNAPSSSQPSASKPATQAPTNPPASNNSGKPQGQRSEREHQRFVEGYRAARALVLDGKYTEAIAAFRALEHDNAPEVANYLGYSYRKLGDYDLAKVWYEKALAADPNHVRTWQYYGLWHLEQGNKLKAQDFLEKIRLLCGESCQDYLDLKGAIERGQHSY